MSEGDTAVCRDCGGTEDIKETCATCGWDLCNDCVHTSENGLDLICEDCKIVEEDEKK